MLILTSANDPMARGVVLAQQAQQQSGVTWVIAVILLVIFGFIVWWWWKKNYKQEGESGESTPQAPAESQRTVEVQEPHGVVPSEPLMPDNLTLIEGIGPKIQGLLQDVGITTFAQLADADVEHLVELLKGAGLHMVDPETWKEQAGLAAKGKWEELEALQKDLKGGHRV